MFHCLRRKTLRQCHNTQKYNSGDPTNNWNTGRPINLPLLAKFLWDLIWVYLCKSLLLLCVRIITLLGIGLNTAGQELHAI